MNERKDAASSRVGAVRQRRVIQPSRPWWSLGLGEFWQSRGLLYFLTCRDIRVRYKQTVLGVLWGLIRPITTMVVFSVIFGGVVGVSSEGVPYPIFCFTGMLPWGFFSRSLTRSSASIINSNALVTRVYIPRLIVPVASVGAGLIDLAISFVILVGLMIHYRVSLTPMLLMVLPLVTVTLLLALGVGTLFCALATAYRDFRFILAFAIQIWMFLTPVIYSSSRIPESWRRYAMFNPMLGVIDGFRSAVFGRPINWTTLGVACAVAVVAFAGGLLYFRRVEQQFADII